MTCYRAAAATHLIVTRGMICAKTCTFAEAWCVCTHFHVSAQAVFCIGGVAGLGIHWQVVHFIKMKGRNECRMNCVTA